MRRAKLSYAKDRSRFELLNLDYPPLIVCIFTQDDLIVQRFKDIRAGRRLSIDVFFFLESSSMVAILDGSEFKEPRGARARIGRKVRAYV